MSYLSRLALVSSLALASAVVIHIVSGIPTYVPRSEATGGNGKGIKGAFEYLAMLRSNVETGQVEVADRLRTAKAVAAFAKAQAKDVGLQWIEMGPDNVGGRIRTIVVDPNNPNLLWSGGVSGGMWKSLDGGNTWLPVVSLDQNLAVSTIAILGNGSIYVGTGNTWEGPSGTGGSGFVGSGLFRSTNGGASFDLVIGPSTAFAPGDNWSEINKIARDPLNADGLWVAARIGLRYYDESENTFTTPTFTPTNSQPCTALEVSTDGNTILAARGAGAAYRSQDGGQSFSLMTQTGSGTGGALPSTSNIGRLELAISPDNSAYMYALAASPSGRMTGVWASTNSGDTWTRIWPPGFGTGAVPELDIFGDNAQGRYDNVVAVRPGHPEEIWVGGVSLWKTSLSGAPQQIALAFDFPGCFACVHADVHEITWLNSTTCFVGCDGGMYKTLDAGNSFAAHNRDLNITQFYSMAFNAEGKVLGGTQDNGTQYIRLQGNTVKEAIEVTGGDGFDCEMSQMDPQVMFTSIYFGAVLRSNDGGNNFGGFYDTRVLALGEPGSLTAGLGDFYTNMALQENYNDQNSQFTVNVGYELLADLAPGESVTFTYRGKIPAVEQTHTYVNTTGSTITDGTIINLELPDRVTSLYAVGFGGNEGVWVTRYAMNFVDSVQWWKVVPSVSGQVNVMEWSADGDHLFFGSSDGRVVRVSGFHDAWDFDHADLSGASYALSVTQILGATGSVCTGICSDPSDPARLLVTHGNYGTTTGGKARLSTNATSPSPTFSNIVSSLSSDLQRMPIYDGIIHATNPAIIVLGTEFGILATDNGGSSWGFENNGIPQVPVFAVRQQRWDYNNNPHGGGYITNPYVIYAGTHGRGIFRSETLMGLAPHGGATVAASNLTVFPNPAIDMVTLLFNLGAREMVSVQVYDLNGRLVKQVANGPMMKGEQRIQLQVGDLTFGTYVAEVVVGDQRRTARFVVGG